MRVNDFHADHGNNVHADDDDFEHHGYWQDLKADSKLMMILMMDIMAKP